MKPGKNNIFIYFFVLLICNSPIFSIADDKISTVPLVNLDTLIALVSALICLDKICFVITLHYQMDFYLHLIFLMYLVL